MKTIGSKIEAYRSKMYSMKKYIIALIAGSIVWSCSKVEEKINETVEQTKEKVRQKAQKAVEETVSESVNSFTHAEDVKMNDVFENQGESIFSDEKGKKFTFPNGTKGYFFKYKAEKSVLIPFLENQPTTDESRSDQKIRKIDGQNIISKIRFAEKFLPANTIDTEFLDDIKNDKNIEYYKLSRFPYQSTIIYNPKNQTVLQYIEKDQ